MSSFISVLQGETMTPPPIWLMRQAGRYLPEYREVRAKAGGFLDLCYRPELAAEVTLQPIRRFGFDAAIIFSDILVVPHALGQRLWFEEGEGPRLDPIGTAGDLAPYDREKLLSHLEPVFEAVAQTRAGLDDEKALIGFCGAPWTVASYMIAGRGTSDLAPVRAVAKEAPERLQTVIDLLVEASSDYLCRKVEAGVDCLQIFESWAGVLEGADFDRWSLEPVGRIIERVRRQHPHIPIIVFPRKSGEGYLKVVERLPVQAVSLDQTVDLEWAKEVLQSNVALQGNIDPGLLVEGGDGLQRAVETLLETLGNGPLIVNLGHGIDKTTPIEHVHQLVDRVRGR